MNSELDSRDASSRIALTYLRHAVGDLLTPSRRAQIIREFESQFPRRRRRNQALRRTGFTDFVSKVLVPELAAKLIEEDMGVDGGKAREILRESVALGGIVHKLH